MGGDEGSGDDKVAREEADDDDDGVAREEADDDDDGDVGEEADDDDDGDAGEEADDDDDDGDAGEEADDDDGNGAGDGDDVALDSEVVEASEESVAGSIDASTGIVASAVSPAMIANTSPWPTIA